MADSSSMIRRVAVDDSHVEEGKSKPQHDNLPRVRKVHGWSDRLLMNPLDGMYKRLGRFGLPVALIVGTILLVVAKRYLYFEKMIYDGGTCEDHGWTPRATKAKVYDAFTFNSELDVLEIRLHELDDVVDKFVLVEAEWTFSGRKKPLFFNQNKHDKRFEKWVKGNRIEHVILDSSHEKHFAHLEYQTAAVRRKAYQKSVGIIQGLDRVGAGPEDLVILPDLDEIPRATVIRLLSTCSGYTPPVSLSLPAFIYDFGCETPPYKKARVVPRRMLQSNCTALSFLTTGAQCPDDLRDPQQIRLGLFSNALFVARAGWHISYFMTLEKVVEKVQSYAHVERNTAKNRNQDYLRCLRCTCMHVNKKEFGTRTGPLKGVAPKWVEQQYLQGNPKMLPFFPQIEDVCGRTGPEQTKILSFC